MQGSSVTQIGKIFNREVALRMRFRGSFIQNTEAHILQLPALYMSY
jgi:hypothetical protein